METSATPFDLNTAVREWRDQLAQSPALGRDQLDELEAHLYDAMGDLQTRGLSPEEAFLIAAKRAGTSSALGNEFGKVNRHRIWLDRVFWMLVGNLAFSTISSVLAPFGSGLVAFGFFQLGGMESEARTGLVLAICCGAVHVLTYTAALWLCWSWFRQDWSRRLRLLSAANQSILRLFAVVAAVVLTLALFRLLPSVVPTFLVKYVSQNAYGRFATGQAYGTAVASVIELTIMVSLTLWLARRRMLAKT